MISRDLRAIAHGLVLVSAVLALIAAALWFRTGPLEPQASAAPNTISTGAGGVPDSGRQRIEMIEQLKALNSRLADVERGLRSGTFVIQTAEQKGAAKAEPKEAGQ
ncbi:MAG TPA: hypothetical protein VM431_01385 [Phycisphaerae bacterium]|nr:hypothetical protein [Phycisphaerae bacterium]